METHDYNFFKGLFLNGNGAVVRVELVVKLHYSKRNLGNSNHFGPSHSLVIFSSWRQASGQGKMDVFWPVV